MRGRLPKRSSALHQASTAPGTVAVKLGEMFVRPNATTVAAGKVYTLTNSAAGNAVAVFELPAEGASASFPDGSMVKVILTNDKGEAMVDIKSNEVPGKYQPTIMVNYLGQSSLIQLNQENINPTGPSIAEYKELRGGGWWDKQELVRASYRARC